MLINLISPLPLGGKTDIVFTNSGFLSNSSSVIHVCSTIKSLLIKSLILFSIINLSSTAGLFGYAQRSPYTSSKWAIIGLTKTLAVELGKFKIRVNAICPGAVNGDRMDRVINAKAKLIKSTSKKVRKELESMVSLNTFVNKEDIASMALFLLSDASENVSGQIMTVDGNTERMN